MDDATVSLNPWHPMRAPIDLKHLGKLIEELGECTAAASRCVIQGIGECEPVTGKRNGEWLEDEIADVLANMELCIDHFSLNKERIFERGKDKAVRLQEWHRMA